MHDCPECGEECDCVSGDIVESNCTHCDDAGDDDFEEFFESEDA
jgi:hypothetical protein